MNTLTPRQQREIDYHRGHAGRVAANFQAISFDVVTSPKRRWWNAYWDMWTDLRRLDLQESRVLVVGCGAGEDALRFASAGAIVSAFDLSPEMIAHGVRLAAQLALHVDFSVMPAERLAYRDNSFDLLFVRDILHHVDIPKTVSELRRVAKPGALFVIDEIYSHSITDKVRRSRFVERFLYQRMLRFVYGSDTQYITLDERKLSETDVGFVHQNLVPNAQRKYFNFIVTRLVPDRYDFLCKLDRIVLVLLGKVARFLAGRIVMIGTLGAKNIPTTNTESSELA